MQIKLQLFVRRLSIRGGRGSLYVRGQERKETASRTNTTQQLYIVFHYYYLYIVYYLVQVLATCCNTTILQWNRLIILFCFILFYCHGRRSG